jgi:hypothetical protein
VTVLRIAKRGAILPLHFVFVLCKCIIMYTCISIPLLYFFYLVSSLQVDFCDRTTLLVAVWSAHPLVAKLSLRFIRAHSLVCTLHQYAILCVPLYCTVLYVRTRTLCLVLSEDRYCLSTLGLRYCLLTSGYGIS